MRQGAGRAMHDGGGHVGVEAGSGSGWDLRGIPATQCPDAHYNLRPAIDRRGGAGMLFPVAACGAYSSWDVTQRYLEVEEALICSVIECFAVPNDVVCLGQRRLRRFLAGFLHVPGAGKRMVSQLVIRNFPI